ncbi:hypothetical protein YP516_0139 [Yersinia pestis Nepal516]|nr:hypothetical protein YP516_0139 [Yersinia pestis Nepal516]
MLLITADRHFINHDYPCIDHISSECELFSEGDWKY